MSTETIYGPETDLRRAEFLGFEWVWLDFTAILEAMLDRIERAERR